MNRIDLDRLRKSRTKTCDAVSVKGTAKLLEGTRVEFKCPVGHTQVEDMNRRSLPVSKRIGESGVRMLLQHWEYTGVTFDCKACTRLRDAQ